MIDKFYIGIDSGGTKCRVSLYNENDGIKYSDVFNSVHYSKVGAKSFSRYIAGFINGILSSNALKISDCLGICAGVAGARLKSNKDEIKKHLTSELSYNNIIIESDTAIAFEDVFNSEDGLILICGTGSVLFGRLGGEFVRFGGWGKILGDEGSSYLIALNFLKRLVKHFDESFNIVAVEKLLNDYYGINRDNIIDKIYHQDFDIASIAPFVVEQAGKGDTICIEVVEKEISGVYELFEIFKNKSGSITKYNVAFTGSLIENDNYFSNILKERLRLNLRGHYVFLDTKINPTMGAIKIALKNFIN